MGALLGLYEFWDSGADARVDMVFSACITVSIAGFFFWYRAGRETARVACYIATAFAVLAQGPAGIALPGVVIVGFLAAEGELRLLWKLWSWHFAASCSSSISAGTRWPTKLAAMNFSGCKYCAKTLTGPWVSAASVIIAIISGAALVSNSNAAVELGVTLVLIRCVRGEREDSACRLLHVWWISISAVLVLVAGKRAIYLLPIYPAIACWRPGQLTR